MNIVLSVCVEYKVKKEVKFYIWFSMFLYYIEYEGKDIGVERGVYR